MDNNAYSVNIHSRNGSGTLTPIKTPIIPDTILPFFNKNLQLIPPVTLITNSKEPILVNGYLQNINLNNNNKQYIYNYYYPSQLIDNNNIVIDSTIINTNENIKKK